MDEFTQNMTSQPFEFFDIDDVRIIIRVKGRHYSILPKDEHKDLAKHERICLLWSLLGAAHHFIIEPSLEEIKTQKEVDL